MLTDWFSVNTYYTLLKLSKCNCISVNYIVESRVFLQYF